MKSARMASGVSHIAVLLIILALWPGTATASENPWLGVIIRDGGGGAQVLEVITGSPADSAGLQVGDVILRVAGSRTTTAATLITTVANQAIGADIDVQIQRGTKVLMVPTTLSRRLTENEIFARRFLDKTFPEFEIPVLAGPGSGDSSDHPGEIVVLYFFDPTCTKCSALSSALAEIDAEDGVSVLAFSGRALAGAKALTKSAVPSGVTVVFDTHGAVRAELKTPVLPAVIVTDRKRQVRYTGLKDDINVKDVRFAVSRALADTEP